MFITDIESCENIHATIIQNLRNLGVKHRSKKTSKKLQEINGPHLFKKSLNHLPLYTITLENGSKFQVPHLVHELCSYISNNLKTEGLFRKAGSTARQKEIKLLLDAGCELSSEHHVIDVANVLKLFFRELPEPLIPYSFHDTLLQCLLAKKGETINALLLTCLLLPPLHLSTLHYFMDFLQRVVHFSNFNKMDIKNIAIVMTPTVMPIEDKVISYTSQRLSHHVQIIQILLENANKLGEVPSSIEDSLHLGKSTNKDEEELIKKKKKRRSASFTRMFHGLKKIVSSRSVDESLKQQHVAIPTPDLLLTPALTRSAKKRKGIQTGGFSSKRRKELLEALPQTSVLASTPFKPGQTPVCHHPKPEEIEATPPVKPTPMNPTPEGFVRIPKSEYEEIKSRVTAIENRISQELNNVQAVVVTSSHVQTIYEKTLEEAEALRSPTTEQLARRFNRELKIRRSSDCKVIRSPSARKIGSIRRRSQEIGKGALKRGRPNTVMSGLPQPSPLKDVKVRGPCYVNVTRASSFHSSNASSSSTVNDNSRLEKWASAEMFFKKGELPPQPLNQTENRESLARLRSQNAGMVLAKAKLFNELSSSDSSKNETQDKITPKKPVRRGGTFPRQSNFRRQKAVEESSEKENESMRKNWETSGKITKSPRRAKPLRVVRH